MRTVNQVDIPFRYKASRCFDSDDWFGPNELNIGVTGCRRLGYTPFAISVSKRVAKEISSWYCSISFTPKATIEQIKEAYRNIPQKMLMLCGIEKVQVAKLKDVVIFHCKEWDSKDDPEIKAAIERAKRNTKRRRHASSAR